MAKRVFVDMDGTLARFHDEVNYLERMWEPGFFRSLKPFQTMTRGIKLFMEQHPDVETFILSSKILPRRTACEAEKNAWLDQYLPEIDAAHRIFPAVGSSKADCVAGGVTKGDYLLDDYNKSLREWEAAGGHAVKCHNNINQHGLGAYGGDRGELWEGAMIHTRDRPEMIAAELARHMDLDFDLQRVVEAYGLKIERGRSTNPNISAFAHYDTIFEADRGNEKPIWYTYKEARSSRGLNYEMEFLNPLNAVRSVKDVAFEEVPLFLKGEMRHLTRAELIDHAFNLGVHPEQDVTKLSPYLLPSEWDRLINAVKTQSNTQRDNEPASGEWQETQRAAECARTIDDDLEL